MKRTRYGETGLSLPTKHGNESKETRLSNRFNLYTSKTTDRATFVKKNSPFGTGARWYIFILFGRAMILEVNK